MPRFVRSLGEAGVDAVVLEAFSAALAAGVHDELEARAGAWTNLSAWIHRSERLGLT